MAVVAAALLVVAPAGIQTTAMAVGSAYEQGCDCSDGKFLHLGLSGCRNLRLLADKKHLPPIKPPKPLPHRR